MNIRKELSKYLKDDDVNKLAKIATKTRKNKEKGLSALNSQLEKIDIMLNKMKYEEWIKSQVYEIIFSYIEDTKAGKVVIK